MKFRLSPFLALWLLGIFLFGLMLYHGAKNATCTGGISSEARNTANNVRNAISSFYVEYRRFPAIPGHIGNHFDFLTDREVMSVLMGADSEFAKEQNPRCITFFSGSPARRNKANQWIRGVAFEEEWGGALFDPYGNQYKVRIGNDANSLVRSPVDNRELEETILVWSAGKDGDFDTWKDNVRTW